MFRKKTTRIRKKRNDRVLHLKVTSPRIMFFQSLKAMRGMMKTIIILILLGFGAFFGYKAVQDHFLNNEDLAIKKLTVSTFEGEETQVLSRKRIIEIAKIDEDGTVFGMDIDDVEKRLLERPEILKVKVTRKLPDTIKVMVKERVPVAWLSCRLLGLAGRNPYKGVLIDEHGVPFRCQKGFWDAAKNLPVLEVEAEKKSDFEIGKKMNHAEAVRALALIKRVHSSYPADSNWMVDRVKVVNFYTLRATCTDGLVAVFGMHEHKRQIDQLIMARTHAYNTGRKINHINLIPKFHIPVIYQGSAARPRQHQRNQQNQNGGEDSTSRSILDRH